MKNRRIAIVVSLAIASVLLLPVQDIALHHEKSELRLKNRVNRLASYQLLDNPVGENMMTVSRLKTYTPAILWAIAELTLRKPMPPPWGYELREVRILNDTARVKMHWREPGRMPGEDVFHRYRVEKWVYENGDWYLDFAPSEWTIEWLDELKSAKQQTGS